MHIRSPYRAPAVHSEHFAPNPRTIRFRHPAIPGTEGNLLFILHGHDGVQGLLHHETARLACAIVAGNQWDGYLAGSPNGPAIDIPEDGLLGNDEYYFIVPHQNNLLSQSQPLRLHARNENCPSGDPASSPTITDQQPQTHTSPYLYPIVPNFREWTFHTGILPGTWATLTKRRSATVASTTDATRLRDQSCRMTDAVEETDVAYIVPLAEEAWFDDNEMIGYGNKLASHNRGINDDANTMLLRADLHRAFDKRRFTFLPKKQCTLVTHVFESESLRAIYHNVALNTTYNAPEYLFARFAWTILPLVKQFLRRRRNRLLLVQGKPQWANPDQCSDYADPPNHKSESASPRKGSSRRCSPTKSRSPSKRSREEMETDGLAQDHKLDPRAGDQDSLSLPTKRQRQPNTILPYAIPAPALPYPQHQPSALLDGSRVPGPPEARSLTLAPSHSLPRFSAHPDGASASMTTPQKTSSHSDLSDPFRSLTYEDDEQQWMTCRDLRAMTTLQLLKERERSDPRGHWEKEEAWLDGILSSGGALDSSEIKRWQYVNGEEVDYPLVGDDGR